MSQNDSGKSERRLERIRRWDDIRRIQFGFTNNLIVALSLALIGFGAGKVKDADFGNRHAAIVLFVSMVVLTVSGILGIWCSCNRLTDFRETSRLTRLRSEGRVQNSMEVIDLRRKIDKIETRSWWLLKWQIRAFGVGFGLLAGAFLLAHWGDYWR